MIIVEVVHEVVSFVDTGINSSIFFGGIFGLEVVVVVEGVIREFFIVDVCIGVKVHVVFVIVNEVVIENVVIIAVVNVVIVVLVVVAVEDVVVYTIGKLD